MRSLWAGVLGLMAGSVMAGDFPPGGNAATLARGFALPELGNPAVLPAGQRELRVFLDISNEYVSEGACASECIVLDGETARLILSERRALGNGWDFGLDIPLLIQGGGFLDSAIEEFHDWGDFPNGGRELAPKNRYEYRYARGGVTVLSVQEPDTDLGDVALRLGRRLGAQFALRGMFKVPTGDGSLMGGDNPGAALWLEAGLPLPERWSGFLAAGVSANERGEVLSAQQNREILFGGAGIRALLTERVHVLAQVYAHSRLFDDSTLTALSRPGVPLTLGLQIQTGPNTRFDLGFQEDLSLTASPDVGLYGALTWRSP
ncbi:MAG: DUF3187 family protein [Nevskiales bacterium]|nr:DUF3187 family protein [Nevskiales bacterium]